MQANSAFRTDLPTSQILTNVKFRQLLLRSPTFEHLGSRIILDLLLNTSSIPLVPHGRQENPAFALIREIIAP